MDFRYTHVFIPGLATIVPLSENNVSINMPSHCQNCGTQDLIFASSKARVLSWPVTISWLLAEDPRLWSQRKRTYYTHGTASRLTISVFVLIPVAPKSLRGDTKGPHMLPAHRLRCVTGKESWGCGTYFISSGTSPALCLHGRDDVIFQHSSLQTHFWEMAWKQTGHGLAFFTYSSRWVGAGKMHGEGCQQSTPGSCHFGLLKNGTWLYQSVSHGTTEAGTKSVPFIVYSTYWRHYH